MRRLPIAALVHRRFASFKVPSTYSSDKIIKNLPFTKCASIWYNSLKANRLQALQDELTELMLPTKHNSNLKKENTKVKIDDEGNFINEISFEINNGSTKPTKHVVFIHGYGASLGCFARNYQIINKLQDTNYNYIVHFLDNISCGLSSNPKIKSQLINNKIEKCPHVKMNDPEPTIKESLHNKYYKLIDSYEIDKDQFKRYQEKFTPILKEIEDYYLDSIEKWRVASNIHNIDYLIGHSFGGYWSSSYALRYPQNLSNLILLSPVGVERHVHAITNPLDEIESQPIKPVVDPTSYRFLSRLPLLSTKHISNWYNLLPYLPRLLKWFGPWGVTKYYRIRYPKLFKVNRVVDNFGGPSLSFLHENDLVIGSNKECHLIFEYLYNSITTGSMSDIYIKYLLTPSTVSKWPLFDKFVSFYKQPQEHKFQIHFLYGEYDFMNAEAGMKLSEKINELNNAPTATFQKIRQGGHNLYLDNPFDTNRTILKLITEDTTK